MGLRNEKTEFYLDQISRSDRRTFRSSVSHLFKFLSSEYKNNDAYNKYKGENEKWLTWPPQHSLRNWQLPDIEEETKSLTFYIYKNIASQDDIWVDRYLQLLFLDSGNTAIGELNSIFLGYLKKIIQEIMFAGIAASSRRYS